MAAKPPYFDTSYLARLYLRDPGFDEVRDLAGGGPVIASAWHAQAEIVSALHGAYREGRIPEGGYYQALDQFLHDSKDGLYHWLPLTDGIQQRLEQAFQKAPATTFLRTSDAMHLACAAQHGFTEVYSNDRHFLAAAPIFGLRGINIIGKEDAR
jgi:predicted nucleic acid-binding protein